MGKGIKFHDVNKDLPTSAAPALGQQNAEVYGAHFSAEEIERLTQEGII